MLEVLYIPRSLALLSLFSIHPPPPEIPNYAMITQQRSLSQSPRSPSGQPFLSVSVTDPAKMSNGVQAYISYKVITKTNLSKFEGPEKIVIRRYSDFIWLRDHLFEKYKGIFIPPLPEKSTVDNGEGQISRDWYFQEEAS
ncbi:hypothetical protein ACSBR1_036056 [Camellia fascicularis]